MSNRFQFISTQEINNSLLKATPPNTKRATNFAVHVYDEWLEERNRAFPKKQLPTLDELPTVSIDAFQNTLSHFVYEIRRKDGKQYPSNTIYGIMCGIIRYFREECNRPDLNFLKEEHIRFFYLRRCIDRRMQEVTEEGVHLQKRQADPIDSDDEDLLWSSKAFNVKTSEGLLSAVYFYTCKVFGLRSRDEHRNLTMDQFIFGEDSKGPYVNFIGKTDKTNKGGLRHRQVSEKNIVHYDSDSSVATYKLLKLYFERLHACGIIDGPFYRRPLVEHCNRPRYGVSPIGVHSISKLLPAAAKKAKIPNSKNITGHSGKVSCATTLYRKNFDEKLIRERTGHRSNALENYKRTSSEQKKEVSKHLDFYFDLNAPTSSRNADLNDMKANFCVSNFCVTSFDISISTDLL